MVLRAAIYQRFDHKTRAAGACLIWTGARNSDGYGVTRDFAGALVLAHRFACELYRARVPAGQVARHACDTPACVAPAHLAPGTQSQNISEAYARGRRSGTPRTFGLPWRVARALAALDDAFVAATTSWPERNQPWSTTRTSLSSMTSASLSLSCLTVTAASLSITCAASGRMPESLPTTAVKALMVAVRLTFSVRQLRLRRGASHVHLHHLPLPGPA